MVKPTVKTERVRGVLLPYLFSNNSNTTGVTT